MVVKSWGRRLLFAMLSVTVVAVEGLPGATVALAADLMTPTVSAYGASDGIFVQWTPQDYNSYTWRLTRTVGGNVTTMDVVGQHYSDTSLLPGQSATYVVAQEDGSTVGPDSTPATAARDAQAWAAPVGARSLELVGPEVPSATPYPQLRTPTGPWQTGDGLVTLGYSGQDISFGYVPGPGTYTVRSTPAPGEIAFRTYCATGQPQGQVVVHDVAYSAAGLPLELGADFSWDCGDGVVQRENVRYNSATPVAHVVLEPPSETPSVVHGGTVTATWQLHNLGDAPARVGTVAVRSDYTGLTPTVSSSCDGVVLDAGASCPLDVQFATTADLTPGPDYSVILNATVGGQPAASVAAALTVYHELVPPVLTWMGRTTNAVHLQVAFPDHYYMQPLSAVIFERQVNGGAWSEVGRPGVTALPEWTDWSVQPGNVVAYRARTLAISGETSEVSAAASGTVPTSAVLWGDSEVVGGGDPSDPDVVRYPLPLYGISTGVAVSPDHAHLVAASYDDRTNTARLHLTDLDGGNPRLLASSTTGHEFTRPHFSPDGRRVAYIASTGSYANVAIVDIATGVVTDVRNQGVPYGWSPDGSAILMGYGQTPYGPAPGLRWVKVSGESVTSVPGTTTVPDENLALTNSVTVSRTGEIVWVAPSSSGAQALYRLPATGGTPSVLWAPPGCSLGEPAFAPNGSELAVQAGGTSCAYSGGTLALQVPPTGLATVARRMSRWAFRQMAWASGEKLAPTAKVAVPAVTATSAQVRLDVSTDPDDAVGGLSYSCRLDAGPWQACGPVWQLNGLAAGAHTVTATATDPSGQTSAPASATWMVDRSGPTVSLGSVPTTLLASAFTLSWTGKDSGGSSVATYDVRERYAAPSGGYTAYVYPPTWQGITSASLPLRFSTGYSFCFSVRARDRVGNVGAFTAERCTAVALDDRSLTTQGGTRGVSTAYLYGTFTRLTGTSQSLTRTGVAARQLGLVVATCSGCGSLDVWIGGVKWGRVSTYSATAAYRRVVWLPLSATTRSGTVVVRPASTRSSYVDGLVIQK